LAIKRIIPISSGKGGVGKTTFAINFSLALSKAGRTVLVDLDTGTSSVRNAIDTPVDKDLYHFFKKDEPLGNCLTKLNWKLDPLEKYKDFSFIASPMHLIEEITNFGADKKRKLIEAINGLDVDYVVLDIKAGLDSNVLDFLPYSNSGVLVFTPHLPSATLAAADIVKAILFRKLRLIFHKESPFFDTLKGDKMDFWRLTNDLIDRVEDSYDPSIENLDAFTADLFQSLGEHPIARTVKRTVDEFRVYYVLNLFNGVQESFDTAVRPFLQNLSGHVSARCSVTNLGWINRSDAVHRANRERIPALLFTPELKRKGEEPWMQELLSLRGGSHASDQPRKAMASTAPSLPEPRTDDPLTAQLDTLKAIFAQRRNDDYRANFDYVTQRVLYTMKTRQPVEFGERRIYPPQQMLQQMYDRTSARDFM